MLETIDSTNDEALRRINTGVVGGEVILARRQTAGRGRHGQTWESPPGNLYLSITVDPPDGRPVGELAFVAGLAAAEAIEAATGGNVRVMLKWPNDLMHAGRKLGGLLIEGATGTGVRTLAVGLGVNLVSFPENASYPATSLAEAGCRVEAIAVAQAFHNHLDGWLRNWANNCFEPVRTAWLARAAGLGGELVVHLPDGKEWIGLFQDIDEQGALVLQTENGMTRTVTAGAIFSVTG
ncbi:MAG: biotin--[acetyl-CoA-carboxylase] ligase [Alphaproteobacteria bacterium]